MAKNWEFDCPQFYDFCNGFEDNTENVQCLGGDSPDPENKFNLKSKNLMKNRFAAWNNKLSTPVNRSPFVNIDRPTNTTDSEKLNEKKKRLSKSEGSLNVMGACNNVSKMDTYCSGFTRKRSASVDGKIRQKKKYLYTPKKVPATPMCLKRTLKKDRSKKLKSTEELELEKIAELQSLTLKHLRLNERNMKKLKQKLKPPTIPKPTLPKKDKTEKSAPVKKFQKELEDVMKKLNRNPRFLISNETKRERLGAVSSESQVEHASSHNLQAPVGDLLNGVQTAVDEKDIINELSFKKYPAHSGLFFHQSNSKKTALKPFNFHDRPEVLSKSTVKVNKENVQVAKTQFSHSFYSSRMKNQSNKENNYSMKAPKSEAGIMKKSFKF